VRAAETPFARTNEAAMARVDELVAAHLILGPREEPFLEALLASIAAVAGHLVVNDNGRGDSPHAGLLERSRFGREGRLIVDRTPFSSFAEARNVCLRAHAANLSSRWVAFVDADEVHADAAARVASHLPDVPAGTGFVDGYTWHFFQSFDYFTSIERRMAFFRFNPQARWTGNVHERLEGVPGRRIALPYVYAHYGHTLTPRRHAEKGRHYSSLGAPGDVLREDQLDDFDVRRYFAPEYPRLLRFYGRHPVAAETTLQRLRPALAPWHALTERAVREQPAGVKLRNLARAANYEVRWRGRALDPLARSLLRSTSY
jgi:hypothetical protein